MSGPSRNLAKIINNTDGSVILTDTERGDLEITVQANDEHTVNAPVPDCSEKKHFKDHHMSLSGQEGVEKWYRCFWNDDNSDHTFQWNDREQYTDRNRNSGTGNWTDWKMTIHKDGGGRVALTVESA